METELEKAFVYICELEEKLKEQYDRIEFLEELIERYESDD